MIYVYSYWVDQPKNTINDKLLSFLFSFFTIQNLSNMTYWQSLHKRDTKQWSSDYHVLLENTKLCEHDVDMLIMVQSHPSNFKRRRYFVFMDVYKNNHKPLTDRNAISVLAIFSDPCIFLVIFFFYYLFNNHFKQGNLHICISNTPPFNILRMNFRG